MVPENRCSASCALLVGKNHLLSTSPSVSGAAPVSSSSVNADRVSAMAVVATSSAKASATDIFIFRIRERLSCNVGIPADPVEDSV